MAGGEAYKPRWRTGMAGGETGEPCKTRRARQVGRYPHQQADRVRGVFA